MSGSIKKDTYTFGDTPTAADRLALLAEVFRPAAVAVLQQWARPGPRLALDLGSGPGHTTRLVHAVTGAAHTTGVERSAAYVAQARTAGGEGIDYLEHDVVDGDLPVPPADLVYARFLLTHLADPGAALARWLRLLAPGGRLIVQETARLTSSHPALARYYELVAQLQRHYGQALEIGSALGRLGAGLDAEVLHSGVRTVSPPAASMARLHELNLRTWRQDPYAGEHFDAAELDAVAAGLARVSRGEDPDASVDQGMGELILQRP
jgi:trans-aconitate 2-methyltransferase